jgi:5-(carboxyamino)imidazole ribonucleotide synthase
MRAAWRLLGSVPCVLEQALTLDTELSVVAARTAGGEVAAFPVAENTHIDGILDLTVVPAAVSRRIADRAIGLAMAIADALDYVGVLAVEMFVVDGELIVNELAPRPHNSGHWTLDVAQTSQFAQQVRAVCGVGLGDTTMTRPAAAMVNLLGDLWTSQVPDWQQVLELPHAALHLYGKSAPRAGRKMGHITTWASSPSEAITLAVRARALLNPA